MKKLMMLAIGAGAFIAIQGVSAKPAEAFGWWGGCGCKSSCRPVLYRACGCVRHYRPRKCCW